MKVGFTIALLAIAVLCDSAVAQENTAEDWYKKGIGAINTASPEEAIKAYDRALEINPDYADAWSGKASALGFQGKNKEAIAAFDKAVESYDNISKINPKDANAWYGKGAALDYRAVQMGSVGSSTEERNKYRKEAIRAFDKAIEANPKYAMAWQLRGAVLHLLGRYEEAVKSFDKALEIDPQLQGAEEGKGLDLAALGRQDESARSYDKVLGYSDDQIKTVAAADSAQNLSNAWLPKGFLLQEQGKYEEAVKALDNATGADPNNGMAWKVKGVILSRELNRYDEAAIAFDNATRIDPGNAAIWLNKSYALDNLALTAYGLNDPDNFTRTLNESLLAVNRAIELDSNNSEAWSEKGFILGHMGPLNHSRYNQSISAYNRAIELDPISFEAWKGKGQVLGLWAGSTHNNSLSEEAVKAFDEAISLNQKEIAPRLLKAATLSNLGILNQSQQVLDEALGVAKQNSERSQIWFEKAHFYAKQGDYNETLRALKEATDLSPQDEDLWINGGFLLSAVLGRYNESISYFDVAIRLNPENAVIWQYKDDALKALGRNSEADAAYAKAKKIGALTVTVAQENTAEGWYKKGQELQRNDSNEEALKAFDKAIELNQSYAFAWSGKGSALFSMGKYEEAIAAWDRAIAIEHDEFFSGSLWEMIGNAQEILGKKNESASAYRKALELADQAVTKQKTSSDLNLSAARGLKGILLDDQGMYEEAIEAYDNATKANPKDAFVLHAKGEILADKLGRYNESLNAYNRSLEIDPKSLGALRGMGSALTSLGRYNEAIKYFDKAIEIDSGFARAWAGKGETLRNLGKYNESIQAYDKSIELLPQQPQYALIGKGMALDSLGRHEEATKAYNEALKDYNRTIEKNPRNAEVMYNEGNALRGLGRYNESLQAYDKAIELNQRYIEAWQGKGYALKALGRNSEADASFAKAKELRTLTVTVVQENTAGYWLKKGYELSINGSNEQALQVYER